MGKYNALWVRAEAPSGGLPSLMSFFTHGSQWNSFTLSSCAASSGQNGQTLKFKTTAWEESSLYSPFDSLIHWVTTGWGIKRQIMTMPSWRWEWRREGQHYRYLKASIFIKVMLWPILWSPNAKSRLTGKDPDSGKDWRQKEKRLTEDGMWMASLMQWTWTWENSRR